MHFGRVIELTAKALKDKSQVERNADRLARLFLPIVLGLALFVDLAARAGQSGIQEWLSFYFKAPQPAKLDRRRVLDALKAGADVPGAELANARLCLSVRTK